MEDIELENPTNENEFNLTNTFPDQVQAPYNFRLLMGGLVIAHRNNKWNSLFLEHPDHHVRASYRIIRNGVPQTEVDIPIAIQPNGGRRHISISVVPAAGAQGAHEHRLPPDGPNSNDISDIEFMGDFAAKELFDGPVQLKFTTPIPLTSFEIDHGLGYTAKLADGGDGVPDDYKFEKGNNKFRNLGHFMGIVNTCQPGSEVELKIGGNAITLPRLNANETLDMMIHNVCTKRHCDYVNDFPKYYTPHGVIANRPVINLTWHPRASYNKEITNFRVACNLMLASELEQPLPVFS